jgi:glutaredoxin 3
MIKAVIYTKKSCTYCEEAKSLLELKNIEYRELDVTRPDILDQLRDLVPEVKTVPQIFIEGTYIGGFRELVDHFK